MGKFFNYYVERSSLGLTRTDDNLPGVPVPGSEVD